MIKETINLLKQPYPSVRNIPNKIYTIFGFGLFVIVFIITFGLAEREGVENLWIIIGFGLITIFVMIFNWILLPLIFPRFFEENNWTVFKEIVFHLCNISLIGTANLIYANTGGYYEINIFTFIDSQLSTFGIAIFPVTFLILFNHNRLLKKYVKAADELNRKIQVSDYSKEKENELNQQINLFSENRNENIQIYLNKLLFIKSVENYVEISMQKNGNINRFYLRQTLKKVDEELIKYSFIFRCHRSYIINLKKIKKIYGNSQGYKLLIEGIETHIPVARSCSKSFKNKFSGITL